MWSLPLSSKVLCTFPISPVCTDSCVLFHVITLKITVKITNYNILIIR
jgi:hypothetical protein